jgi:hypothetical protein
VLDDDQLEDLFGGMIEQPRMIEEEPSDDSKDDLLEQAEIEDIQPAEVVEERKVSSIELTNMLKD